MRTPWNLMRIARLLIILVGLGLTFGATPLHSSAVATPASVPADPILTAWIINTDGHTNPHFTGPVNVQSVTQTTINGVPYAQVHTNSIADYYTTITSDLLQELNS